MSAGSRTRALVSGHVAAHRARPRPENSSLPEHRLAAIRTPVAGLITCVLVAFLVYGSLAANVEAPRIFDDELRYFDAAGSLAAGDGLTVRGEPYRFAPLYPILLAPITWAAPDRETAYELAKWLNALFFALSAVPIYLLARRLVRPWPSVAVAALSMAVPSAMYVSVVMTESVAYFFAASALLAMMLAFERPTRVRQLSALSAAALATAVRPQFAALFGAYVLGLVAVALLGQRRSIGRDVIRPLWPSVAALGLAATASVAGLLVSGREPRDLLGSYSSVWREYDFRDVATYLFAELGNFELYLAVVPIVVAPVVVWSLLRQPRSRRDTAFVSLFVMANAFLFLLVASADSALEELVRPDFQLIHDRYLFYLVPLWLLVVFVWLDRGMPRPRGPLTLGALLAVAAPLSLSITANTTTNGTQHINATASSIWAGVDFGLGGLQFGARGALLVVVSALVAATIALPRRALRSLPAVALVVLVLTADIAWYLADREARTFAEATRGTSRTWVDDAVGRDGSVTLLAAGSQCRGWESTRRAILLSEFFNSGVDRAAFVGPPPDPLPYWDARIHRSGRVLLPSGELMRADYVLTEPGLRLEGRRVAQGTRAKLALWEVRGQVRVIGVASNRDFEQAVCRHRPRPSARVL